MKVIKIPGTSIVFECCEDNKVDGVTVNPGLLMVHNRKNKNWMHCYYFLKELTTPRLLDTHDMPITVGIYNRVATNRYKTPFVMALLGSELIFILITGSLFGDYEFIGHPNPVYQD